jgi:ribose 5-phosphate isomerase RpiB
LVLPADYIDDELAIKIVKSWIEAKFKGEKYQKRLDMIDGEK